jgi:hypothetical protein
MLYLVLELKMIIKIFDLVHVVDLGTCMEKINVHQAKTHFSAILEKARMRALCRWIRIASCGGGRLKSN